MIDPHEPLDRQVERQARIIDALVRRANRQHEVGTTAYGAFQSAIALQAQVWAKTRDLERTASELHSARADRERTRKNLAEALSAMEGGFALFTEGRLEAYNDLFRALLPDVADRVVPGLPLDDYLAAMDDSEHVVSADSHLPGAASRRGGTGTPMQSRVIELTGDRWYQVNLQSSSSDNVVLLMTEITDLVRRNRSEKENLIEGHADYLQAVFENMTSGVCTFAPDGTLMMHNSQFRRLLGLPFTMLQKGTEMGRLLDFMKTYRLVEEDAELELAIWQERLDRQGRLRKRVRHALGRVLDLHAHKLPGGGVLVELKDVTLEHRATEMLENRVAERTAELTRANQRLTEQYEQKARVEEELRQAKERAEAAVSSKTRFLAAASHDLLQPINAAKLLIATLVDSAQGTAMAPTVERLDGSFTSIEHLLHALLDISRLESTDATLTPSDVCLGTLMRGVAEDQGHVAALKGVRLDVVPTMAFVRSDPVYLLRSIQNLVVNAIQYTPAGGRVLVGCRRAGDRLVLQVWDTGVGISRKDQKRIFEEFARADNVPAGSGMGLGLSIVDRTCRHLGHRVRVRSKPGVGSVFSIEMELVEGQPARSEERGGETTGDEDICDHIVLVIENDPDVLYATTQKLETWGASVLPAASTAEALGFVRDMGLPPDIILADYQLDDGDTGDRAIAAIREATGVKVPAIMITADRRDVVLRRGAELGFSVLTKPVQLSRLRPLIDWKIRWQAPDDAA
ncbi:PAS domain-containing hybrid sensor histidine kinase/response regulator [Salipiger mucosus]|uniref:histidine kinase n=1 Tax=Salipiger mucosus DSM 16094 TaxID=1123237 RepID=S9Q960_9RHOB|nr:PAS-domain containing protein [Salipiger mucosus]EPX76123.1 Signal transduction histidine kinase [Salipiger mucosus DSM 16094]